MSALVPAKAPVVSIALARRIEAFGLPPSIAHNLPASVAAALTLRKHSPEYETQPVAGLDYVAIDLGEVASRDDLAHALAVTQAAMKPGNPADCLMATARLRAVARQRATITSDEKLALAVYAEKLAKYPPDVVAMACERWLELSPFWPSVSELLRMCDWAMQPRRALALELQRRLSVEQPYTLREPV
jgi:hypothetical protein